MIENNFDFTLVNSFGFESPEVDWIIRNKIGSPDELLRELAAQCTYLAQRKALYTVQNVFGTLVGKLTGRPWDSLPKLKPGDTLFIPGAYWLDSHIMRFYRAAARKGIKLVVLLHDVLPITHPDLMIKHSDRFFAPILRLPIHVIIGARSTESELPRAAELIPRAKMPISVDVVSFAHEFPGVARNQPPREQSDRLRDLVHGRNFVLYVSTVEVRKNHLRLVEVWNRLAKDLGDALPLLVIAGKRGWKAKEVIELLDAANERDRSRRREPIVFVEGPSDAELQWLYASCDFTVFPSLAEGWGLPVGESLWFGKACAASQTTSIPEVGQGLCVYFDPTRPDEMEAAIKTLLDPAVRAAYESKIKSAPLRTWHDAGRDLAMAVMAHVSDLSVAAAEPQGEVTAARNSYSSMWQPDTPVS
ncbi:glycosyltransferase family 4 protein [Methyloferula stellata]|uniref:glycosyltransferase family 4 protein n=1 Tax=Methyloferula stellata TaxID=876270 RepID=UPI00039F6C66|nr:glycosyltransferase family 1 protein [Methyloferula stellata]